MYRGAFKVTGLNSVNPNVVFLMGSRLLLVRDSKGDDPVVEYE